MFPTLSPPGVHGLRVADEFHPDALALREELLAYPDWIEMRQADRHGGTLVNPARQNGLTTAHLDDGHRARLPRAMAFRDFLTANLGPLCDAFGIPPAASMEIEINAMAYGEGAWLSPHTDAGAGAGSARRIAWMLYLTHPDDGEWRVERGGALRVCEPDGQDERLRPKFNRFAAFAVSADSVHEIEPVRWACGWTRCRLALSGWVRAADAGDRLTRLYVRRAQAAADRAAAEARLLGTLASARLLGQQQRHAGLDPADADERRQRAARDLDAHRAAPPGTVFVEYVPGPAGGMIVLDEAGTVLYFGPEGGISA